MSQVANTSRSHFGCGAFHTRGIEMSGKTQKWFRVELVNVQTIGAYCGCGEGKTLEEAQENAMRKARRIDPDAKLSPGGSQVRFAGGVNC